MSARVVVLTYQSPQSNLITDRLLAAYGDCVVGIVRSDVVVAGKSAVGSVAFLARHTGLGFVARKACELALGALAWRWSRITRRRPAVPSLAALAADARVPLVGATDVNASGTLATVRAWRPTLLVSINLNQRIGRELLDVAGGDALNVHGAMLPRNRGLFPYFWTLANGDADAGVTVHWVNERFDTGDVILQRAYPILPGDTVAGLAWIGAEIGADLLVHALARIIDGRASRTPQDETAASYFSWPRRTDVRRLRRNGRRYGPLLDGWREVRGTVNRTARLAALPPCAWCAAEPASRASSPARSARPA